jgi:HK97 family phage major capsid protein
MPYNSLVDRTDSGALIPEDVSDEIFKGVVEKSAALRLFRHRAMTRAQQRLPVLSLLPTAYFVTGDTGIKQTTEANWTNKYLNAEEIAVIVPIPQNVLDDTAYDLWAEIKPLLEEAIAIALDDAVFFGTNKPASWPTAIIPAAVAAGNQVIAGTSSVDTNEDINQVFGTIESDGYIPNGGFGRMNLRAFFRGSRDAQKGFLWDPAGPANTGVADNEGPPVLQGASVYGVTTYLSRGGFAGFVTGAANYSAVWGDFSQGILGVRKDIEFETFREGVITDGAGLIVYNLIQQDMAALRAVCRFGWQVPNPINRLQQVEANRYPFGVLKQKATTGGE